MEMKLTVGLSVAAVAAIGFAALSFGNDDEAAQESDPLVVAQTGLKSETAPIEPTEVQKGFQSMAVDADLPECRVPRPPIDLAAKAYIRNSYATILQIMAMQRWQETGSCECFYNQISWEEAIEESAKYETEDAPVPPFNAAELRALAEDLTQQHAAACKK